MKIIIQYDENGWGKVKKVKDKQKMLNEIKEKFKLNDRLAEEIFTAYLYAVCGESTVFQDELLKTYKNVADFLDKFLVIK
jgi:hypothetical protein